MLNWALGDSTYEYASTSPKLQLDGTAYAYGELRLRIGGARDEWDFVSFEAADGVRLEWAWVKVSLVSFRTC